MKHLHKIPVISLLLIATTGCAPFLNDSTIYKNGVATVPRAPNVDGYLSFRFMERWRITYNWIGGPVEARGCAFSLNPFKMAGAGGDLMFEKNSPLLEWQGSIIWPNYDPKKKEVFIYLNNKLGGITDRFSLGTYNGSEFKRFAPFCEEAFTSSYNGFGAYIIKPDPDKGTGAWIEGSEPVTINGLHWLYKKYPMVERGRAMENGVASTMEKWVLPIPDTSYWLAFEFNANFKYSIHQQPERHKVMFDLFQKIIQSVKLEPISPIIRPKDFISIEKCPQMKPNKILRCTIDPAMFSVPALSEVK